MAADRLERHDGALEQHPVAQEIAVLADIGADIEHTVDFKPRQQLAEVQGEVALLHLVQRDDVVAHERLILSTESFTILSMLSPLWAE